MKEIQTQFGRLAKGKLTYIKVSILVLVIILIGILGYKNFALKSLPNQNEDPTRVPFALGPNTAPNVIAPTTPQPTSN